MGEVPERFLFDRMLRKMGCGETYQFSIEPKHFKTFLVLCPNYKSLPVIRRATKFIWTVTLIAMTNPVSPWECNTWAAVQKEVAFRKARGIQFYESKMYNVALAKFTKALIYLASWRTFEDVPPHEAAEMNELNIACCLNSAQCYLAQGDAQRSITCCDKALEIDPDHKKALLKKAYSFLVLKKWEDGLKIAKKVLEKDPNDTRAQWMITEATKRAAQEDSRERQMYEDMLRPMTDEEEKKYGTLRNDLGKVLEMEKPIVNAGVDPKLMMVLGFISVVISMLIAMYFVNDKPGVSTQPTE